MIRDPFGKAVGFSKLVCKTRLDLVFFKTGKFLFSIPMKISPLSLHNFSHVTYSACKFHVLTMVPVLQGLAEMPCLSMEPLTLPPNGPFFLLHSCGISGL